MKVKTEELSFRKHPKPAAIAIGCQMLANPVLLVRQAFSTNRDRLIALVCCLLSHAL